MLSVTRSATIDVRVKPRSKHDRIEATAEGIQIRVNALPVDGKANDRVLKLLSEKLGVPKSALKIVSGSSARIKRVAVDGLSSQEIHARLIEI